jgi:hypothetical protein
LAFHVSRPIRLLGLSVSNPKEEHELASAARSNPIQLKLEFKDYYI